MVTRNTTKTASVCQKIGLTQTKNLLEALQSIADGRIRDCGPDQLGTVSLDIQAMQAIARAAIKKAKGIK